MKASELAISADFMSALRAWGDNTAFERSSKEANLGRFASEAVPFQQPHEWLYRGHCVEADQFEALLAGGSVKVNLGGAYSSWTADSDVAHTFARFAGCDAAIVIMHQGLRSFFDFSLLGRALEATGAFPDEEDYPLHDPIREQEVIVTGPAEISITLKDVMEAFYFDEDGDQRHWVSS